MLTGVRVRWRRGEKKDGCAANPPSVHTRPPARSSPRAARFGPVLYQIARACGSSRRRMFVPLPSFFCVYTHAKMSDRAADGFANLLRGSLYTLYGERERADVVRRYIRIYLYGCVCRRGKRLRAYRWTVREGCTYVNGVSLFCFRLWGGRKMPAAWCGCRSVRISRVTDKPAKT